MSYTISTLTLSILRCRYGVGVCVRMCVEGETAKSHFLLRTVSTSLFIYKMVSGVPFCPLLPCHYARVHTLPKNISSITILLSGPRHNWKCPNVNAIKIFDITQNVR